MLIASIVAASTAATAHATARSRTRPASTSRRSASSCFESFSPRTGRSGSRMTAAATTGPNRAPRPTSSTPATAWKPRARSSRSSVASQRILPPAGSGRIEESAILFALAETGGLALESAKVVQFGAADAAGAHHIDVIDDAGIHREDALDALAEGDLADGDALAHSRVVPGNDRAFEGLKALFVAFLNLDVNPDGVAGAELGVDFGPLVLLNKLGQQRVLHGIFLNLLVYTNMAGFAGACGRG